MTDLRRDCIEAGARKFYEIMSARGPTDLTFDVAYPDEQADFLRVTAQVLDAILSVLSERADEWYDQTMQDIFGTDPAGWPMATFGPKALLAVLGDT